MAEKLKIMLVDDHYLVRMGLTSIIGLEQDMTICAEAQSGEQAVGLFAQRRPDVTLMDVRLPGMSGIAATEAIRADFPDAKVIVLSTYISDEEVYAALKVGAMAYLVKSVAREELIQAIRKAAAGRRHVPADLAARPADRPPPPPFSPPPSQAHGRRGACRPASSTCSACSSAASAIAKSPTRSTSPRA